MSPVLKVIHPVGLLDRTKASQFNQEVSNCVEKQSDKAESGAEVVLIDFKDVTFMDSSGLGAVVLAIKTVQSAGSQIYVCSLNNQVKMLFELAGLDKVIEIFEHQPEFEEKVLSKQTP